MVTIHDFYGNDMGPLIMGLVVREPYPAVCPPAVIPEPEVDAAFPVEASTWICRKRLELKIWPALNGSNRGIEDDEESEIKKKVFLSP